VCSSDLTIICRELSHLNKFRVIRLSPFYEFPDKTKELNWKDLYTGTLLSFTERIKDEANIDNYISDWCMH
jgi:hypothetical protein